jgi:hypothetical protein
MLFQWAPHLHIGAKETITTSLENHVGHARVMENTLVKFRLVNVSFCLFICLSVCLSAKKIACPTVSQIVCLIVSLSVCLCVCPID